uniref:Uncharacterized protein n=1 Tax=Arundo donax TaxID=35708 RepID=A0A0A8YFI1_ARUDO
MLTGTLKGILHKTTSYNQKSKMLLRKNNHNYCSQSLTSVPTENNFLCFRICIVPFAMPEKITD